MKIRPSRKYMRAANKGDILISVLVFAAIAVTVTIGLVNWGAALLIGARVAVQREQAFQIAEAGINYYQSHLAQLPGDYQDGTSHAGPYNHNFADKNGNVIGTYTLTITPPSVGSTNVGIVSKGTVPTNPAIPDGSTVSRSIQATLVNPSFAQYAIVSNESLSFPVGTNVYGPIMSNGPIHFAGVASNIISSAISVDGTGTFNAGTLAPVSPIDFSALSTGFTQLQTIASSSGSSYQKSQYDYGSGEPSPALGYHVILNANGTFALYIVTALVQADSGCSDSAAGWGTWSIQSQSLVGTYPIPTQGLLFFNDDVWVDGSVNGSRLTIVATNITVNSNLLYTNYDGTDAIGLTAQNNINIGLVSADTLHIDGALMAENGRIGRFYYSSSCRVSGMDYYDRSTLTLNGMIATNGHYGFTFSDGTGYQTRNMSYDVNLVGNPPPYFPTIGGSSGAGGGYRVASWKEVQ